MRLWLDQRSSALAWTVGSLVRLGLYAPTTAASELRRLRVVNVTAPGLSYPHVTGGKGGAKGGSKSAKGRSGDNAVVARAPSAIAVRFEGVVIGRKRVRSDGAWHLRAHGAVSTAYE